MTLRRFSEAVECCVAPPLKLLIASANEVDETEIKKPLVNRSVIEALQPIDKVEKREPRQPDYVATAGAEGEKLRFRIS